MIAQGARLRIERLLLSQLIVTETASYFPEKFAIYLDLLTAYPEQDVDPLIVKPSVHPGLFAIDNGKHRFTASIMAGRKDALCIIVEEKENV
jgi:hypothetical protein